MNAFDFMHIEVIKFTLLVYATVFVSKGRDAKREVF